MTDIDTKEVYRQLGRARAVARWTKATLEQRKEVGKQLAEARAESKKKRDAER